MSSCLSPEKGHCIVFLSKTIIIYMYSQSSVSLKPGQDQSQTNSIYSLNFIKIIFIKAMTLISNSQNSPKFTTFGMASIKFMIPSCASVTNKVYIPVLLLSSKKPMYYKNRLEYMTLFSSNCFFNEPIIK